MDRRPTRCGAPAMSGFATRPGTASRSTRPRDRGPRDRRGPRAGRPRCRRCPDAGGARLPGGPRAALPGRAGGPAGAPAMPEPPRSPRAPSSTSWPRRPRSGPIASWRVAETPPDLLDRRVEITGPAEPKMMINALNSGARVFMADLEDALSPTWANVVGGQAALRDAVRGTLAFTSPEGKAYRVGERPADAPRPAAGLAPRRAAPARRRRADVGEPLRRGAVPVPQRRGAAGARHRPVPLPAQAPVAPRGAALERRLPLGAGRARDPARERPGDGAHRDDPRRVRDGRDPLGAPRARGRAERRALGLPLQLHQDVRVAAGRRSCRTVPS